MKTRRQEGHIFKDAGYWYVRFYQDEIGESGQIVRRQRAKKLARVSEYRSKKSVEPLRDEMLERLQVNSPHYNPESTMTIAGFVKEHFFPHHVSQLKPSVRPSYECNWKKHLEPVCGQIRLRDFRTSDGERVMRELVRRNLGRNTVRHCKSILSGIFSEAIRLGVLDTGNPVREVRIPSSKLRPPEETGAYSLEEITRMLRNLIGPARAIIAVFAYTGLRKGEVAALRWESWRDGALWVEQSAWRTQLTDPKSVKSKSPVPVIAPLAAILSEHLNGRAEGLMFRSSRGTPLNLDNFAKRTIRPLLEKLGIGWHGFHAFRRGLATNLNEMGVDPKVVQAIMRHADFQTTMNHYVKAVPESARKAMEGLERLICSQYAVEKDLDRCETPVTRLN
ncbi:MAG: site-specific integrase [Acidobacteria bacterium]|nr:site-specific integrase [Acidobacteriota bacterium]